MVSDNWRPVIVPGVAAYAEEALSESEAALMDALQERLRLSAVTAMTQEGVPVQQSGIITHPSSPHGAPTRDPFNGDINGVVRTIIADRIEGMHRGG
jgi:hypothetical protein